LSEFAGCIEGFPSNSEDRRSFEFGSPDPGYAGGYCRVSFHCVDRAGHARVEVVIEDRQQRMESAKFGFPILAAGVDQFIFQLRQLERDQDGEAVLENATLG
jgi:hypothetical protein